MSTHNHKIRTRYDERTPEGVRFTGVSRTKQEFAKDSDINTLVARFKKTGVVPQNAFVTRQPFYGDFSSGLDFQQALEAQIRVEEEFSRLPAEVRWKFRNNPANLLDYLADPANHDEAVKLGLIIPARDAEPIAVRLAHGSLDVNVPGDTKQGPASEGSGKSPEASQ